MNESSNDRSEISSGWLLLPVVVLVAVFLPSIVSSAQRAPSSRTLQAITKLDETATATSTLTGTLTATATVTDTATATATSATTAVLTSTLTATGTPSATATVQPPATGTTEQKATICHRTGSGSNPYVQITVDQHALPAHRSHGDIVPAPSAGCPASLTATAVSTPAGTATATRSTTPRATRTVTQTAIATAAVASKVTICHATGSRTNPYTRIVVDERGLSGHGKHPNDIIPAPSSGCPASLPAPAMSDGGGKTTGNGNGNGNGTTNTKGSAPGKSNGNGNGNGNGNSNSKGNGSKKP